MSLFVEQKPPLIIDCKWLLKRTLEQRLLSLLLAKGMLPPRKTDH